MKVLARKIIGIALAMTMLFSSVAFATVKTVTWKSSNKKVASVSKSGKVTAKKAGKATITVKTDDGGKTAKCTITVK